MCIPTAWLQCSDHIKHSQLLLATSCSRLVMNELSWLWAGVHKISSFSRQRQETRSNANSRSMHYVGEVGISNYSTTFSAASVVGACLIAVFAATVSLGLFFRFKSHWSGLAWKRILCAALLALAISSMHWVAVVGTIYRAKQNFTSQGGVSATTAGWMCGVLVG